MAAMHAFGVLTLASNAFSSTKTMARPYFSKVGRLHRAPQCQAYFSVQSPARHSPVHFRLCRSFSRHGVVVILGCNSQCVASSEVAIGCLFQYFGTMRGEITLKVEPLKLQTETFTRLQAPSEAAVSGTLAESA